MANSAFIYLITIEIPKCSTYTQTHTHKWGKGKTSTSSIKNHNWFLLRVSTSERVTEREKESEKREKERERVKEWWYLNGDASQCNHKNRELYIEKARIFANVNGENTVIFINLGKNRERERARECKQMYSQVQGSLLTSLPWMLKRIKETLFLFSCV